MYSPSQTGTKQRGDLVYQAMTIGAIVTVLVSVWVF